MNIEDRKEWFFEAFRTSPIGMALVGLNGDILFANPTFHQMLGYHDVNLPYMNICDIFNSTPEKSILTENMIKENSMLNYIHEYPIAQSSGYIIWVRVTLSPVLASSGELQCYTVYLIDITTNKTAELELEKFEKLSLAGRLAAGIAHEVRNPLTSIKGFIQLIKNSHSDPNGYLGVVLDEIDHMESILSELLIIGRPREVRFEWNDFKALLEKVTMLIKTQGALNNVEINTTYLTSIPQIYCDSIQIKQVFINFLKNAIEAMPDGGVIQIVAGMEDNRLVVIIKDQGVGIPKEQFQNLGQPFFTTKKSGTGLGLSICYQIIHNHNGNIDFLSDSDGTTVKISLPVEVTVTKSKNIPDS